MPRDKTPIRHAVWPTPAPPVCTHYWDQDSWDKFAAGYRPEDYHGDMHDQAAWDAHRAQINKTYVDNFYQQHGVER